MSNIIDIIKDSDIGYEDKPLINPQIRYASRGIVINDDGLIAVFNKVLKNEYKLPGGGQEHLETPIDAFKREVLEETGCTIKDIKEIGIIEEYKSHTHFKQVSNVFVSKVDKQISKLNLTKKEVDEGGSLLWMTLEEALIKMKSCFDNIKPSIYESVYITQFIVKRDIRILEYYQENYKIK